MAVSHCIATGEGGALKLRLGGKTCVQSRQPVDIDVRIMAIRHELSQPFGTAREPMGTVIWLRGSDDLDILINTLRIQVYDPQVFVQMGIAIETKHLVVVKSTFHFHSAFRKLTDKTLLVDIPGLVSPDTGKLTFTRRCRDYWPATDRKTL